MTRRCGQPSTPRGAVPATCATPATHASNTRVGRWMTAAGPDPSAPAARPPVRPHAIAGPAAGTASRLAGNATTGSPPNTGISTGATPNWAAAVTPKTSARNRGPGTARAIGRARRRIPADAATDSWNPSAPMSRGSTRTSTTTASDSVRMPDTSRPNVPAVVAISAMTVARNTDGSNRVISAKKNNTPATVTKRERIPMRDRTGRTTASTNATFSPDTTRRWLRPDPRNSSMVSASCARSSPRTNPRNNARWSPGSTDAPRCRVRRNSLASADNGSPRSTAST